MKAFLLSSLAVLCLAKAGMAQTTLYVPGSYPSIQAAVNASTHPLDVVEVATGNYSGAININKSLSIHGPNIGTTGNGIRLAEAVISDSKITISGANTVSIDGIKIFQTNATNDAVLLGGTSVVTLKNCIVERFGLATGIIARAITASAGPGAKTIVNNLFIGDVSGGLFSGHKTWNSGIYLNAAGSTVLIQNNVFQNCRTGINLDDFNAGINISGNTFENNGTHMSFGGVSPTSGQFVLPVNAFKTPVDATINLSNVNVNFRLDISSSTLNGLPFAAYPLTNLFQIEQSMYHRGRSGRNGLVTYVPNHQYVIPVNPSIQSAINYAVAGHTIQVSPGTFTENINLNLKVNILGSGSGSDPATNTLLTQTAAGSGDSKVGVVQLNASGTIGDPVLIKDIRILPQGIAGISVGKFVQSTGTNISYVSLDNVHVYGTNQPSACSEQERGLYVDLTSSLSNLSIANSAFNSLIYGWYFQKAVTADASTVSMVTVTNTEFKDNVSKGLYAEKLANASFDGCSVTNNGDATWGNTCVFFKPFLTGFDINLKAGTYQNIAIRNSVFTGNGTGEAKEGAALVIKARNDAPAYALFPASLANVVVENCIITGNERGIRIGEPDKINAGPTNVVIRNNSINGNLKTYSGTDGTAYGNIINLSAASVSATCNWFGSNVSSTVAAGVFGPVTFIPFLENGNDGSANIGFQPTAACGVTPLVCNFKAICGEQGLTHNGSPVPATRSDFTNAEVAQKSDLPGPLNFISLGFGGYITLKSNCQVKDGPGNDIKIWETSYGAQVVNSFSEKARVFASQDGINFLPLGVATFDAGFDLSSAGLLWASYFKIMDVTLDFPGNAATADGFDLDGIEVLNGYTEIASAPPITQGGAASVCGGTQGKAKNFSKISPLRSNPSKATGLPQNDGKLNFYSLGFGGDICLRFDFAIFDGPGGELKLVETTFGNLSCNAYKERVELSVSFDGISWNVLGEYCQDYDAAIDITPANSGIQYVRIKDVSNRADFSSSIADGYDLDAVVALPSISGAPCPVQNNGRIATAPPVLFDETTIPEEMENLQILGNPVGSQLNLRFTMFSEKTEVFISNHMGQKVMQESQTGNLWELKEMKLPVSQLAPGVYFLSVGTGAQKETTQFVKL
jgi:hypothetical protein